MPVSAVQKVSRGQNGVGAFILRCRKLSFHYCDWAGSSRGMNAFLRHNLAAFARANPAIEIEISPRANHHPVIRGHYINGAQRAICVRNLQKEQILTKAEILRDASGEKVKRVTKPVRSANPGVRGIWSPFHHHRVVAALGQDFKNWKI